ncbi:hypothetical protein B0H14DRAFT_2591087 [Mycena olivaceomarginata]|nr:hypothetical protein B0H14DRAFT_2591087 [Mycena olivaceomarginata]
MPAFSIGESMFNLLSSAPTTAETSGFVIVRQEAMASLTCLEFAHATDTVNLHATQKSAHSAEHCFSTHVQQLMRAEVLQFRESESRLTKFMFASERPLSVHEWTAKRIEEGNTPWSETNLRPKKSELRLGEDSVVRVPSRAQGLEVESLI